MRVKSKIALRGLRHRERVAKMNEAAPAGVRVIPAKDEYRGVLKHPKSGGFPSSGAATWADDRFTKRRLADGSVTRESTESKPEAPPNGEARQREQRSQSRHRIEHHESSNDPKPAA